MTVATCTTESVVAPTETTFDGVICFGGEDYWYHNRGHYDMQMMRELSQSLPVVYVNSIGMRTPRMTEGRMFLKRVARKLRSVRRGLVRVRDRFWVVSPIAAPGRLGPLVNRRLLAGQIRRAAERAGIRRPLVWVACPPGAEVIDELHPAAIVYQRTDRFESFHGVDENQIRAYDRLLKQRAQVTLFCSSHLYDSEAADCRCAAFVDHGVDFERFSSAGGSVPVDLESIARPRVGFIGGIDAHTFDPALLLDVARRLPSHEFVLVGACSLPEGWCDLSNVHLLGQKPYESVADYMAACDVLIMPWNSSEWIKACNPVKLKEYLAVGRPVVSTPFPELERYSSLVFIARDAAEFAAAIESAIRDHDPEPGRRRVERETWDAKARVVLGALRSAGFAPETPLE